jgi:hypothetical protein
MRKTVAFSRFRNVASWSIATSQFWQHYHALLPHIRSSADKQFSSHLPILATPQQRHFRTRIREGVEKGWRVWINGEWRREQNRPGPNFAGRYIVIVWDCGPGCIQMAVSDAESGTVYNPPISEGGFALPMLTFPNSAGRAAEIQYRKNSRLMIIKATPHVDHGTRFRTPSTSYGRETVGHCCGGYESKSSSPSIFPPLGMPP